MWQLLTAIVVVYVTIVAYRLTKDMIAAVRGIRESNDNEVKEIGQRAQQQRAEALRAAQAPSGHQAWVDWLMRQARVNPNYDYYSSVFWQIYGSRGPAHFHATILARASQLVPYGVARPDGHELTVRMVLIVTSVGEEGVRLLALKKRASAPRQAHGWWLRLGLTERPKTLADARAAYRAAVVKAHPDHGGTVDKFAAVRGAMREAERELR